MSNKASIKEQIRRNLVALISLAIALTSLGYNTWRNEASEENRNQRLVSIEMLVMLGDLQQITLDCHYGEDNQRAALLREGWSKVLTIRDLSSLAARSVPASAGNLYSTWGDNYSGLGSDVGAKDTVIAALEAVRADLHEVLQSLD